MFILATSPTTALLILFYKSRHVRVFGKVIINLAKLPENKNKEKSIWYYTPLIGAQNEEIMSMILVLLPDSTKNFLSLQLDNQIIISIAGHIFSNQRLFMKSANWNIKCFIIWIMPWGTFTNTKNYTQEISIVFVSNFSFFPRQKIIKPATCFLPS